MAKKNWIRLAASPQVSSTTTNGDFTQVDLSAYVDPLRSKAFRIMSAKVMVMSDGVPYGLNNSSNAANTPVNVGLQIATGTQTAILRPSDGKVIYHNFASYMHDVDANTQWQFFEWDVTDIWPDGYVAVVDTLTASMDADANFSGACRATFTIAGYQESVTSNQLASLLVAQTQ
jgi:hypothetical protein